MDRKNQRLPGMDKNDALKLNRRYLKRVRNSKLDFAEAWHFGSYAKGNQHEDSDIDIVLNETVTHKFETDIQFMLICKGNETLIDPHVLTKDEFNPRLPIVNQILRYGEQIAL